MPDAPPPLVRNHVRRPDLPWRTAQLTECGRGVEGLANLVTRDEALAMLAKYGRQRASFMLCMTCLTTAENYPIWEDDPVRALAREFRPGTIPYAGLKDELTALTALVAEHREEFDKFMSGIGQTSSLEDARRRRARRAAGGR